jgi:hypothetical protein
MVSEMLEKAAVVSKCDPVLNLKIPMMRNGLKCNELQVFEDRDDKIARINEFLGVKGQMKRIQIEQNQVDIWTWEGYWVGFNSFYRSHIRIAYYHY